MKRTYEDVNDTLETFYDVNEPEEESLWYAIQKDAEDNDWGTGSYIYKNAVEMAKVYGESAQIAVIKDAESENAICVDVIHYSDF